MPHSLKTSLITIRIALLTVIYFICFAVVSAMLLRVPSEQAASSESSGAVAALLGVSLLNTSVLAYLILRSRWTGWKLTVAIFFVLYGVTTVMPQIETAFFVTRVPPGLLPRLFLAGALFGMLYSPIAVLVLGKGKRNAAKEDGPRLGMPTGEWAVKLSLIAIAYLVIYFTFGYYIAWQNAAVRAYYGGSDPGSLLAQMTAVANDTPWLVPLQIARAFMWTAIAVPVIRMMKGERWEAGLAVALLFAVVMNSQLLLPNALMPQEVRMVHLVETAASNFLFGWLVALVLLWRCRE